MSFLEKLNWRYATKVFDTTKKVSTEDKEKILNAIRMAPTSYGIQPFHVTVVEDQSIRSELKKSAYNQGQITDSTFLLVFSAKTDILNRIDQYFDVASGGSPEIKAGMKGYQDMMKGALGGLNADGAKAWASKQAYIALGFGLAACAELGIDACPMEGFNADEFKKILKLPENQYPQALIAVGYRSSGDSALTRPKVRFPESELFS